MQESLLEILSSNYNSEPDDPFNLYSLALAYYKVDKKKSLDLFQKCHSTFESYLPTYYQLGHLLEEFERMDAAIEVYQKGIILAKKQSKNKTAAELQNALDLISDDY